MPLTQAQLKRLLAYDPETGDFTWLVRPSYRAAPGNLAGSLTAQGYRCIQIAGRKYKAHRLAWFYTTGEWPAHDIDHRDEDKANNRWLNLRPATRSQNMLNKGSRSDNKSGIKGVSWDRRRGLWHAQLQTRGRKIHVGHYVDKGEAAMAIHNARTQHHGEFANHGAAT